MGRVTTRHVGADVAAQTKSIRRLAVKRGPRVATAVQRHGDGRHRLPGADVSTHGNGDTHV